MAGNSITVHRGENLVWNFQNEAPHEFSVCADFDLTALTSYLATCSGEGVDTIRVYIGQYGNNIIGATKDTIGHLTPVFVPVRNDVELLTDALVFDEGNIHPPPATSVLNCTLYQNTLDPSFDPNDPA